MSNQRNLDHSAQEKPSTLGPRYRLAGRDKRLLGALIDALINIFALVPGMALLIADLFQMEGQYKMGTLSFAGVGAMVLALLIVFLVQLYLALVRSQSIGKYFVKTQILDFETKVPAGLVKTVILRLFVCSAIQLIPIVGYIFLLVDFIFLFRADRRCVHDMIAGTEVVDIG